MGQQLPKLHLQQVLQGTVFLLTQMSRARCTECILQGSIATQFKWYGKFNATFVCSADSWHFFDSHNSKRISKIEPARLTKLC